MPYRNPSPQHLGAIATLSTDILLAMVHHDPNSASPEVAYALAQRHVEYVAAVHDAVNPALVPGSIQILHQ